jgi:hypothetical protein
VENFYHFFAIPGELGASKEVELQLASALKTKNDGHFRDNGTLRATMQDVAHTAKPEGRQHMAAITLFTCLCGVQKKTSNHWVLAKVTSRGITFMPWDTELAMSRDIVILCGEGCAASLLSRSLGEWKRPVARVSGIELELAVA